MILTVFQNIAAFLLLPIFFFFCLMALAFALLSQAMVYPSLFILWLTATPEHYERLKKQIWGEQ